MPTPPPSDDRPADCAGFEQLVHRVLDGDAAVTDLFADPHPGSCRPCRHERDGAVLLLDGLKRFPEPVPPPGFADRTTRAAVADFRRRRALRWSARAGVGALAASLLVVWLSSRPVPGGQSDPAPGLTPEPNRFAHRDPPPESIREQFGEAGSAVVTLTRKATNDTLSPARNLFATPPGSKVSAKQPAVNLPEPLADMPGAAKAGLEPLTNTAKRAVNLFLRDVGGATGAGKVKS